VQAAEGLAAPVPMSSTQTFQAMSPSNVSKPCMRPQRGWLHPSTSSTQTFQAMSPSKVSKQCFQAVYEAAEELAAPTSGAPHNPSLTCRHAGGRVSIRRGRAGVPGEGNEGSGDGWSAQARGGFGRVYARFVLGAEPCVCVFVCLRLKWESEEGTDPSLTHTHTHTPHTHVRAGGGVGRAAGHHARREQRGRPSRQLGTAAAAAAGPRGHWHPPAACDGGVRPGAAEAELVVVVWLWHL